MGNKHCAPAAARVSKKKQKEIERYLRDEHTRERLSFLITGVSGAGKSTAIQRCVRNLELPDQNTLRTITNQCLYSRCSYHISLENQVLQYLAEEDSLPEEVRAYCASSKMKEIEYRYGNVGPVLSAEEETELREAYTQQQLRCTLELLDPGADYLANLFLNENDGFEYTIEDLLRMRLKTTGIVETDFPLSDFCDIGVENIVRCYFRMFYRRFTMTLGGIDPYRTRRAAKRTQEMVALLS